MRFSDLYGSYRLFHVAQFTLCGQELCHDSTTVTRLWVGRRKRWEVNGGVYCVLLYARMGLAE